MATDINSVTLCGRLTRDMEVKYSSSGFAIGNFSLATSQSRKNGDTWEEQSHFFDCTLLGKRADALSQYMKKGQQIVVLGSLQQDRWQDSESGANRSKVKILVNDIQLVGGKKAEAPAKADDDFSSEIPF
jgi:single-strand DNA-binding protein